MVKSAFLPELDGCFSTPHDEPPKWLCTLMYTAYLDETGQQADGWIFVTGFLGNEAQWKEFIPKWKAGLGKRKSFHMHRLRWKHLRTQKLLAKLGPIPASCGLKGIVGGVKFSDYQDLINESVIEKLAHGYIQCIYPLIFAILQQIPKDEKVEVYFGPQDRFRKHAINVLDFMAKTIKDYPECCTSSGSLKLSKYSFAIPGEYPLMFGPSDYLSSAWAHNKADKTSKKAQWSKPILDSTQCFGTVFERDEVRKQITSSIDDITGRGYDFYKKVTQPL